MRNLRWKAFNHIPEKTLIGILVRLPVKSLLRFLCVCKLWGSLIGSSGFIGTHLNSNIGHSLGMKKRFQIHGSSNGLLCPSDVPLRYYSPIWICNPSTKKFEFRSRLNDCKVVRIVNFQNYKKSCFEVEVYSISTNSWKRIQAIPHLIKTMWWHSGSAFHNGVAYRIMAKAISILCLLIQGLKFSKN
ncbi:hypothetical protein D8674_005808 [Pyrus ussuriensis x Pyrus communis]|uniref:F-box domain-containing protein n=1 Tax=Pyrus ussuriensis x Pyrus communis TaxID=2448454 RepID=A0A5N5FWV9_9ROSA|nr:hypothetical protein D8674_005808 [Pyrus ussuriensis x Pyrus communis]